ncbi:hypothetical protein D3C81_1899880 [compost metagenome]
MLTRIPPINGLLSLPKVNQHSIRILNAAAAPVAKAMFGVLRVGCVTDSPVGR